MRLIGTVPAGEMKSSAEYFEPGDVLYGRLRPYLNKVFLAGFEGLCSAEFIAFRKVSHLDSKYLQYFLNSWEFVSFASRLNAGDRPRVNFSQLADYPFPFPPLAEQRRIIAEIEKQLTRLDAGVAALRDAHAKLKRYKAAVLKAACEGRLVPQDPADEPASALLRRILAERRQKWEAEQVARGKDPQGQHYEEPAPPDTSDLPGLPEGWEGVKIDALFDASYGLSESLSKTEPDDPLDLPVIRIPNVTEFGGLDLSHLKYFPLAQGDARSRLLLRNGDVLFNWRNAPKWIGRSATFEREGDFVNASFLLKLRPYSLGYSRFVALYLNYLRIKGYFLTRVDNAVNQANFNASKTKQIDVALPPLAEQQRIVAEVERRLSVVEELEAAVKANLARAGRLRQSILKRAFEGQLVPQDPADEPASVLLERIRAERAAQVQRPKPVKEGKRVKGSGQQPRLL